MKKLLFIFIAVLAFNCSSDDSPEGPDNPACAAPTNISVNNITTNSVSLGWTNSSSINFFEVEYGELSFSLGEGTLISTNTPPDITGLESNTAYDVYVRSNCGGDNFSEWTGPNSFITD